MTENRKRPGGTRSIMLTSLGYREEEKTVRELKYAVQVQEALGSGGAKSSPEEGFDETKLRRVVAQKWNASTRAR
jgi:hypothetical protein